MIDSYKHSSLLRCGADYSRKKFYGTGPKNPFDKKVPIVADKISVEK
jgi:hypothetical protein